MTVYSERQLMPYTPEQMFQLVAAVERYPEFLPWCAGSRILKRENNVIYADLIIGWKVIREKFGSKVTLTEPSKIHLDYFNGPLKYLHGDWQFTPNPGGGTIVDFHVDFDFKSRLLSHCNGRAYSARSSTVWSAPSNPAPMRFTDRGGEPTAHQPGPAHQAVKQKAPSSVVRSIERRIRRAVAAEHCARSVVVRPPADNPNQTSPTGLSGLSAVGAGNAGYRARRRQPRSGRRRPRPSPPRPRR